MVARKTSTKDRSQSGGGNYFAKQQAGVDFFSSGSKILDLTLGGGWAFDRVSNIVGDNSTGKTLLAIEGGTNFLMECRKRGWKGRVRYREREHAFDQSYAEAIGMPIGEIDFGDDDTPFDTVEDLYDEIDYRCEHSDGQTRQLIIVDSLDALTSRAEMERKIDDASYGGEKAKKMSELFRRKIGDMSDAHITLMIISQTRDKIGVTFGKKWTRTGGKALNFYASQILYLAHKNHVFGTVKGIKRPVGDAIVAKMDKNKVGLPFRSAEFDILFGFGIDDMTGCLDWAKENKCDGEIFQGFGSKLKFENAVAKMDSKEFRQELARVHKIVERNYWEIEKSFLPTRKKYG